MIGEASLKSYILLIVARYRSISQNLASPKATIGTILNGNSSGEFIEFEVSGDKIEAVYMIPGWTHNIINLSETENLVTIMTCNEIFDCNHPDTFSEMVE